MVSATHVEIQRVLNGRIFRDEQFVMVTRKVTARPFVRGFWDLPPRGRKETRVTEKLRSEPALKWN
jgi:hypothetical protein